MDDFRAKLLDIRCRNNSQNHYFYPHQAVHELVTSKVIYNILRNHEFEPFATESIVQYLEDTGGRRIFAILTLIQRPYLILNFIKDDQLQRGDPDHKLPFNENQLKDLLPPPTSTEFWDKQWEFTAPFFSESVFARVLPDEFILPFLDEELVAEGALGRVYKVQIEQSYLPPGTSWQGELVRKELKAAGGTRADFEKELYNLSMLRMLKHPNIVEMLAAYTFKGRHNLLFRKADSKTLGDLLEGSPHSPFRNLEQMILAISGLSSALQAVHNFHFPDLEILAIGCHHDLKPDNILVHEGSFLLADFGLSTIKDSRKASYTSFKNVRGDYVAPECENFEELSKRNVINRASDIWSLGCIILELLVFTVLGPDGVTDFELERGFKIGDHKRYRFHHGFGVESPAVALKLDQLQNRLKDLAGRDLLILSREMLNLYPKRRPSAIEVEEKMQFVTIQVLCEDIHQRCSRVLQISRSMQAWLILSKFVGWMEICKLGQHGFLERWHPIRFPNYQLTRKCLQNMQGILTAILPDCESHLAHIYRPLHDLNHTLYEALPNDLRDQAEVIFKSKVLDNVDNSGLDDIANNTSIPRNQAVLCVMARVRLLSALVDDDAVAAFPELKIDPSFLKKENPGIGSGPLVGRRALGFLQNGRTEDRRVLIESKEYAIDISEPCLREYVNRLSTLTKLLQEAGPGFRILPCSGYYHDPGRDICGLVFEYPPSPHPASELQFTTLKAGLDQYYRKPMPYLALENRFQLAYDLAVSLQNFHEAEWLHKKISSFNVGFFHHKDEPWLHVMGKPYFIGFMHSRPSGRSAYSEYFEDPRETDYQHPEYLEGEGDVRYRLQFDYYSLGLILLEIGRWETLEHMREKFDDREDMREKLRYDKIRRLGQSMGSIYQRATAVCLGDELRPTAGMENSANEDKEIRLKFSDMVVRQLARCTV